MEDLIQDLRQLRQLILSGMPIVPEDRLAPGMRVRVRTGPLSGQEGFVLQRRGETRLLVAVRFLPRPTGGYWEDRGYEWFAGV